MAVLRGSQIPPDFWLAPCLASSVLFLISCTSLFDWHIQQITFSHQNFKMIWRLSGDGSNDIHMPMLGLIGLIIAKYLHYNAKSPRRRDIYVGSPAFFLGPAVPPQFFHSRIATGVNKQTLYINCQITAPMFTCWVKRTNKKAMNAWNEPRHPRHGFSEANE